MKIQIGEHIKNLGGTHTCSCIFGHKQTYQYRRVGNRGRESAAEIQHRRRARGDLRDSIPRKQEKTLNPKPKENLVLIQRTENKGEPHHDLDLEGRGDSRDFMPQDLLQIVVVFSNGERRRLRLT